MNVLSLFDGMSCGQIALERAGIKYNNYFASEIDKWAIQITQKNYPNTIQLGDVIKIRGTNLPKIDLLIGGSPCQGFSYAGNGLNFKDPRSALFFEFVRLQKECAPKYFLLENVIMKNEWQDIISQHLGVLPIRIDSSLVSAQKRNRLYWTNISNITQPRNSNCFLQDILENLEFQNLPYEEKYKSNKPVYYRSKKFIPLRANAGSKTRGIAICNGNGYWRKLSPIECERLQTVPDNYTAGVSDAQRYKMLGNGWTIKVISHIFSFIGGWNESTTII